MQLYGEHNVPWGKHEDLQRFWAMLAHMHVLHRTQRFDLLGARLGQYLKAVEQTVYAGSDWTVGWQLTGLPEPRAKKRPGRGLTTPQEFASSVDYVKEMRQLEEAPWKASQPSKPNPKDPKGKGKGKDQGDQEQP